MLTQERRDIITELVNDNGAVTVQELVEKLDTSAATIRRDLTELDRQKKIVKVFGGATAVNSVNAQDNVTGKFGINVEEKEAIGRQAAGLVHDGDYIYIDAGTTTLQMIDFITARDVHFYTNGIAHAKRLLDKGFSVSVVGGRLKKSTEAIVGPDSVQALQKYHFTCAFMGTNGVSVDAGFTTPDVDEGMVKAEAVHHSAMTYVLADHTKFGQVSPVTFAKLSDCSIITDRKPDHRYLSETQIEYPGGTSEKGEPQ